MQAILVLAGPNRARRNRWWLAAGPSDETTLPCHRFRNTATMHLLGRAPAVRQPGRKVTDMGMIGAYARITTAQLSQALQDPRWAADHLAELAENTYPAQDSAATDRFVDVDKAWNGIWFLLNAAGSPIDVVAGGAPVSDEDLGYGPARYLTPGEVAAAASYLQAMPWQQLASHFDPAQMTADGIYPAIWDNDHALDYLRSNYAVLVQFFGAAAAAGDAVILWLT